MFLRNGCELDEKIIFKLLYFDYVCSLYYKLSQNIFRGRQSIFTSTFSNYLENKSLKTENAGL